MSNNVHTGHRERMRKKFYESGFENFEEHEVLEFMLFSIIPRSNTNEIAHKLIEKYGSVYEVCNADIEGLKEIKGISEKSASFLKMIPHVLKVYMNVKNDKKKLDSSHLVCEYFMHKFWGERVEKVCIVCLDDKLNVIESKFVSNGQLSNVSVNIRSIVEFTYKCKSECIIMAHNHPNGDAVPSDNDINATVEIVKALKSVGINLIDHIIVAGNKAVSMNELGVFSLL